MHQKIEYARRQALDAYGLAAESLDTRVREDWLNVATMWEALGRQYEHMAKLSEAAMIAPDDGG